MKYREFHYRWEWQLRSSAKEIALEPIETTQKGFDEQRFELWRVSARDNLKT